MSTLALVVAITLAVATPLIGQSSDKAQRAMNILAWLGVVGGFVSLQFGEANLGVATATVALAGLATLRCQSEAPDRRRRILAFGAAIPLIVAIVGLRCVQGAGSPWSGQLVLYTAAWAAAVAGVSTLMASTAVARAPLGPGPALASVGALGGLAIAGTGRSSLAEQFYGFPLQSGEEPLQWVLGPVPKFEDGVRLAVAVEVDWMLWAIGALGAAALIAGSLAFFGRARRAQLFAWAGAALGAGGITFSLQSIARTLSMPDPAPYADHVKRMLLSADVADRVKNTGEFSVPADGAELSISMAALAPEIFALGLVTILGLVAIFVIVRHSDDSSDLDVDLAFARDHAARGVGFLWVSWCVLLLAHNLFLGAPGMASPGEWVYVGTILAGTGLLLYGWRLENTVERRLMLFTPGLIVGALFIVAGVAWRFGALPGLSLGVL